MIFETSARYLAENGKRNLTVKHIPSGIKITSPDYFTHEKSNEELKSEIWEVMKVAIKIWGKMQPTT